TETTVHVTDHPLRSTDVAQRVGSPIGVRIPDLREYVLDEGQEPSPVGVVGEVYVCGAGFPRGYLGCAALTGERFVPEPFSAEPGSRMYRTGDLGRWLADGTLEYLGRNDHQGKIRGYRIELGEGEGRLPSAEGGGQVVAVVREGR